MQATKLDDLLKLSKLEQALVTKFRNLLALEHAKTFSSDDFRMYNLDKHFENPQQDIGSFFAKLVHQRLIKKVGHTRSLLPQNNMREIKLYEWSEG